MSETILPEKPTSRIQEAARWLLDLPPMVWLAVCAVLMVVVSVVTFSGPLSLASQGQRRWQDIGTLNFYSVAGAARYVVGFAALFGVYALGYKLGIKRLAGKFTNRQVIIVAALGLAFSVSLLPMYPFDAMDVYDYILRGRMSAFYGLNPFRDVGSEVPTSDPLLRYASGSWINGNSSYGPVWETLAHRMAQLAGDDPNTNVIAFKLLAVFFYIVTTGFIGLTLRHIAPRRVLVGVYLFAWNPQVVLATAGSGHNDTLMVAAVVASIYYLSRRSYVYATIAAILGMLVKFIPAMLLPVIAVIALRKWDTPQANQLIGLGTIGLFGVFYLFQLARVWRKPDTVTAIHALTVALTFYLLVSALWFQAWYVTWIIALAALLDNTALRRLILYFSYMVTWQGLLYRYVEPRPPAGYTDGWQDITVIPVYMGFAWGYVVWFWISGWIRGGKRSALLVSVGERLCHAREAAGLSEVELADEMALRTDDLRSYERGEKAMPLDTAERRIQRLGMTVEGLFTP